jgi:hypothetical protein
VSPEAPVATVAAPGAEPGEVARGPAVVEELAARGSLHAARDLRAERLRSAERAGGRGGSGAAIVRVAIAAITVAPSSRIETCQLESPGTSSSSGAALAIRFGSVTTRRGSSRTTRIDPSVRDVPRREDGS